MKKNRIYNILLLFFALIFLVSSGMLIHKLIQEKRQGDAFAGLAEIFTEEAALEDVEPYPSGGGAAAESGAAGQPVTEAEMIRADWQSRISGYRQLYEQNNDFTGWIKVEGTVIDYPVMYTPDQRDYYLKRNFEKQNSAFGVPYISELCILGEEGTNLLIYGHHMKNGSMFAALEGYRDEGFYREHPYVRFDTLAESGLYEVVGSWLIPNAGVQNQQVEELFQLLFAQDEEHFEQDWQNVQKNFFVNTGISVSYHDKLLALVTCDYSYNDSRIVVIARRLEE